jgi:hypothetical protein
LTEKGEIMIRRTAVCVLFLLGSWFARKTYAEDIYVPGDFPTITLALAQARIDRLSHGLSSKETITIHVGSGHFVGSYSKTKPTIEALPLYLDVPNLVLHGETILTDDADGLPTGFVHGTETTLVANPPLSGEEQALIVIGPTSSGLSGNGVTVDGFVLDAGHGTNGKGQDIAIDRVKDFAVRANVLTGGAKTGAGTRASSGAVEGNFITGLGEGAIFRAGNKNSPALVAFRRNRSVANVIGGVLLLGSGYRGVTFPGLSPIDRRTMFDSLIGEVSGNDLSDNNGVPHFSFGIGCFQIQRDIPAGQSTGGLTVVVSGNRIVNNWFGVVIDAGFPFRDDPRLWQGTFDGSFTANTVAENLQSPAVITFTKVAGGEIYKYLQDSTVRLRYTGGDLDGYLFDHPATDPIDGRILGNTLVVNGVTIPNGRNFQ